MKIILFLSLISILIFSLIFFVSVVAGLIFKVPFVSSKKRVMKKMVEIANLKPNQKIYDLGCGDGRFLFYAEKKCGISGVGYEIALSAYLLANIKKLIYGYKSKVFLKDFMKVDISDADVIFCYLLSPYVLKVVEKAKKECKPGTIVISNTFRAQGWIPYQTYQKDKEKGLPNIYVYKID